MSIIAQAHNLCVSTLYRAQSLLLRSEIVTVQHKVKFRYATLCNESCSHRLLIELRRCRPRLLPEL